jgi:hypothetical protein
MAPRTASGTQLAASELGVMAQHWSRECPRLVRPSTSTTAVKAWIVYVAAAAAKAVAAVAGNEPMLLGAVGAVRQGELRMS